VLFSGMCHRSLAKSGANPPNTANMTLHHHSSLAILTVAIMTIMTFRAAAETLTLDVSAPIPPARSDGFKLGTARSPDGHQITVNSQTILRDGKPWLPVMGEFHYSRYPANEWRDELLKMKAGGITMVATYVFWIHHEEEEGRFDWTGQRSLRDFVLACKDVGLPVIVRSGPWCHGEVRNGGLPDWILPMGRALRTQDPAFMAKVRILYGQVAEQLKGLLWKDGGPVIGMQFDNEYGGPAAYLLNLKQIAQELGMDVPMYTRTGWPNLRTPMPFGEMLPLYGAYAEGFWDRNTNVMPAKYWFAFVFSTIRGDASIGTDVLGDQQQGDDSEAKLYPFLSCELGGGMMTSYHRRILIDPRDIESVALVKTGSGSNLPGYYMYHGGTNPQGKLTTLNEAQNTRNTNYNDLPVKTYDFQAPLGEFGQVRPHYHGLRRLHMFLSDWGGELAVMPATAPAGQQRKNDTEKVRWAVRSDGKSGFLFVSNYQRLLPMPAKPGVQFEIKLANSSVRVPAAPFTIAADTYFCWPFNMDLGGARLAYATAQPVCKVQDQQMTCFFFAPTRDIPAEFVFEGNGITFEGVAGQAVQGNTVRLTPPAQGWTAPLVVKTADGKKASIVLMDDATSRACWKGTTGGRERAFISRGNLIFDGDKLRVQADNPQDLAVSMFESGGFKAINLSATPAQPPVQASIDQVKSAGALREIKQGSQRVTEAPSDADFEQAAIYRIKLPEGVDANRDLILRIHYTGDVARIYLDGQLLTDNFCNGTAFDLGLKRYGPDIYKKELLLKVLPLQKGAPVYLAKEAMPDFGDAPSAMKIAKVEVVERREAVMSLK
jgi:beta-galactosidase